MLTISILNNTNWKFVHHKVDRIINLCGPGPRGTGLQNLREAIIQTKWKYDLAMEDKQVQDDIVCSLTRYIHRKAGEHAFLASWNGNFFQNLYIFLLYTSTKCLLKLSSTMDITITALNSLVAKLIAFLKTRYFYLICFATYAKEFGPGGFEKSFVTVSYFNLSLLFDMNLQLSVDGRTCPSKNNDWGGKGWAWVVQVQSHPDGKGFSTHLHLTGLLTHVHWAVDPCWPMFTGLLTQLRWRQLKQW